MIGNQFVLALGAKLVIDLFAGGGGASTGIEQAIGRPVDIAVNHDPKALAMHQANHPQTKHLRTNVWDLVPRDVCAGMPVGLLWASPDCRHFSPAKGGAPVSDRVRSLAWVVIKWASQVRPDVILLENIPEFKNWGPVVAGRPCAARRGKTFQRWRKQLQQLGYVVEFRELVAADYDTPTTRKRLFMIARCDGQPIVWPKPTNGPGLKPYRTAASCIDWSIACPSIFERLRPLAPATMRRIAHGVWRYVVTAAKPFIVPLTHQGAPRTYDTAEPFRTITAAHRGELALTAPVIARIGQTGHSEMRARGADEGISTITTKAEHLLVAASLVKHYGGEPQPGRTSQPVESPAPTVMAQGGKQALCATFLAKHYGGNETPGVPVDGPASTITTQDHHHLVASTLVKLRGTSNSAASNEPLATVSAGGWHHAEVRALLLAYYGTDQDAQLTNPLPTATTRDRFAVVTVAGQDYVIADIGMRMLQPRELFRAQGFDDSYIIEWGIEPETGRRITLTKSDQVRMCGNSVCPPLARAIVAANYADFAMREAA